MPPVGLVETLAAEPEQAISLPALQRDIEDQHALYRSDRYDSVAKKLPGILDMATHLDVSG